LSMASPYHWTQPAAPATSTVTASVIGLPTSSDSRSASSSARARSSSAHRSITALRSAGGRRRQRPSSKAARAAATARSTSAAVQAGTSASTRPSRGLTDGNVAPPAAATNAPSTNARPSGTSSPARRTQSACVATAATSVLLAAGVAADRVLVEHDAEARLVGHRDGAVGLDPDGLGEHEVAPLAGPPRRVVGELDVRPAAHAGDDVQVGQQADAVGPGVGREPAVGGQRQLTDRDRKSTRL